MTGIPGHAGDDEGQSGNDVWRSGLFRVEEVALRELGGIVFPE
jgi:hypothetical protein